MNRARKEYNANNVWKKAKFKPIQRERENNSPK